MGELVPLVPGQEELEGWSEAHPWALALAQAWANRAPRARSWLPRQIGRKLGSGWRTMIRSDTGTLLAVDSSNLDVYTAIARDGSHEPWVLQTCLRLLNPGDVFFDIGANAGFVALSVGAHFRDHDVTVIAFEPLPSLARCIAVSAHLNELEQVHVFETMLGDKDGNAALYVAAHSVHASALAREPDAAPMDRPIWRIDSLIAAGVVRPPAVIKIDVEGAELDVLRGAQNLLREQVPCVVLEANENMERFGYGRSDLLSYISSRADYSFFGIRPDGELVDVDDDENPDLLALPRRAL